MCWINAVFWATSPSVNSAKSRPFLRPEGGNSQVTITGNTWTPPNSVTPVHDDDGNMTYDGRWDSVWDAENRLIRMQTVFYSGFPHIRLDFVYDSQNRRVSKTVFTSNDGTTWIFSSNLRSLYDGWNLIAEYSAPSAESTTLTLQAAHVWGIDLSGTLQGAGGVGGLLCSTLTGENSATNNYYPAYDGNGNISAWLGASGNLLARMDYSPFGQLVAQYKFTGTGDTTLSRLPFGFSTKYTDAETGMLNYGLRIYNPLTGGWQSKDLIEESGGLNLYGFVGNNGVNEWDMLGLAPEIVLDRLADKQGQRIADGSSGNSFSGTISFNINDIADNVATGTITLGVELTRTGELRLDYVRLASELTAKGLSKADAEAARDALKLAFREKQTALGKAIQEQILRQRQLSGHVTGRNNPGKTNVKLNANARVMKYSGRAMATVGFAIEIYNVASAPEGERAGEAARAGGRIGGGFAGGAATGATLGALGANPITVGAGVLIGGIIGSIIGEGAVELVCPEKDYQ